MNRYEITFQTWNKVAAIYQDNFMDLDLYNSTYAEFCELIQKPKPQIFEIGCGPGNITKYLLSRRPDFNIWAIDVAPNMIALARKNVPEANFTLMDCRTINTLSTKFDGIMCGFCMPYLSKEASAKLLKDCADLLNPGGIFYCSTIEGDYEKSGYESGSNSRDKMFVYYHQESFLRQALKANGLELLNLVRLEYQKQSNTTETHLIFIASKPE
ncbi:MAG: class I SAM-dependent methyltransferase [Adhaeribacter sp.]